MLSKFATAALAATMTFAVSAAMAGGGDYAFEPVVPEMKKGDDVTVAVRLTSKTTGKPVPDAVIFKTRVDMAPDGMEAMTSKVETLPAGEPGVYRFKLNLSMAGGWRFKMAAKIQGEAETAQGEVVLKAGD